MRNVWIIFRKEMRSYFASPIAYLLLTMFAVLCGWFFWNALAYFVVEGMEMQMNGQNFPMNINEQIIRPLLMNVSVLGLFFVPLITMRLFAEEKRTGTIELLATSPVRDFQIIFGKWLAALALYACMLTGSPLRLATWACCCRRVHCWRSEPSSPRSPATRSSPAPRPLAPVSCFMSLAGSAVTTLPPGPASLTIFPSPRTSALSAKASLSQRMQSSISLSFSQGSFLRRALWNLCAGGHKAKEWQVSG
jgi:hypothetical protein